MNKKQIVEELSTNSRFSKQTLLKMNLPELKKLFAEISSKQQQPDPEPEPKPVTRREPVLRDFSSDDEEEEESEDQKESEPPVKQRISNVKKQIKKQPKKNKNKIKPPKVEIKNDEDEEEDNYKSPSPPPSPKPLSTSELRKVLRTDYFKHYERDIKEVINEYRRGDFGENCLVAEYNLLRDEFVDKLQSFLDSQRKLSEAQLDYVDSLLQRVADKVQDALNKR
jgi:hypothetical protein